MSLQVPNLSSAAPAPVPVAPVVLVLGGFLTGPPLYWPLRRRLLARGAAGIVVADVWTPQWLLAGMRGLGPVVRRAERALARAEDLALATSAARGAPILVVGHSAGGIVARILTADEPFHGNPCGAADRIGAIVTLGAPHAVRSDGPLGSRLGTIASSFAERVVPGAFHAPRVGYVAVGSRAVVGRPGGTGRERIAARMYRALGGPPTGGPTEGDGLVPLRSALLAGATRVVLDDALHGQGSGEGWYGDERSVDTWWPVALRAWRSALEARQRAPAAGAASWRPGTVAARPTV